jgi:hypothetical protein
MAKTKYGQHIITEVVKESAMNNNHMIMAHDGELKLDCSIGYSCVTKEILFDRAHAHDYDEILCFIGTDPADIRKLGAEVELCLGEEGEKHIIDTAAVVTAPAGLVHCPLHIKNVKEPIVFLTIALTREYGPVVARTQH